MFTMMMLISDEDALCSVVLDDNAVAVAAGLHNSSL
jgi:hypothetical protein